MQWNLIKFRKENKLLQKDMAQLLSISTEAYRLKEIGDSQFKGNEMFLISQYFNESIEEIFLPTKYTKSIQKCKS
ncbi:helix-turn-helix transcriptional regulator [Staphylococcus xylosus]